MMSSISLSDCCMTWRSGHTGAQDTLRNNNNNNNKASIPSVPLSCACAFRDGLLRAAAHGCSRRRDLCAAEEGATTACSVASRAAVDRDGPGSSPAPLCAKECWARVAQRSTEPEDCQGGDGVLRDVRGLRCGGWGSAAVSCGCAAVGAASAAHREADRRPSARGPAAPRR